MSYIDLSAQGSGPPMLSRWAVRWSLGAGARCRYLRYTGVDTGGFLHQTQPLPYLQSSSPRYAG